MKSKPFLVPLLALTLLAAACGRLTGDGGGSGGDGGDATGGISHATGANDLLVRVSVGGGFVPVEYSLREIPTFSLYGDGRLITLGPQIEIYPGPALPNLLQQQLSEEAVQAILAAAAEAGLLDGDADYGSNCIADAATTTFTVSAAGSTSVVAAYALFEGEGACPGEDQAARAKLLRFQETLGDLAGLAGPDGIGAEEPYAFEELRVYATGYRDGQDPALEQEPVAWPLEGDLARFGEPAAIEGFRCGVVSGEELQSLAPLATASNELTPWTSGGERYGLIFRPLLPDEHGC